jgi:hypothetical protein
MVKNGDATKAMNFIRDSRDAAEDFKAVKEGRPIHDWPHVDCVWYDCVTQFFYWKGPVTGKEMLMSRKQFMKDVWYPYFKWIDLHTSFWFCSVYSTGLWRRPAATSSGQERHARRRILHFEVWSNVI